MSFTKCIMSEKQLEIQNRTVYIKTCPMANLYKGPTCREGQYAGITKLVSLRFFLPV